MEPADVARGAQPAALRRRGCCRPVARAQHRAWDQASRPDAGPGRPEQVLPRPGAPQRPVSEQEPKVRREAPAPEAPRPPAPQPSSARAWAHRAWGRPSWEQPRCLPPHRWTRRQRAYRRHRMTHEDAARRGLPPSMTRTSRTRPDRSVGRELPYWSHRALLLTRVPGPCLPLLSCLRGSDFRRRASC